jgi:curved DNA-binding protein CbpA
MVDWEADRDVIQAAYRQLARKYHPDRGTDLPPDAAGKMVEINAAWELLGDPDRRADYDRERAASARYASAPSTSASTTNGAPRRPYDPYRTAARPSAQPGPPPPPGGGDQWAGPPPGNAAGSVLNFGRYSGWSLGEIARVDPAYLDWLERMPIGRSYRSEVQAMLRARATPPAAAPPKKKAFGR